MTNTSAPWAVETRVQGAPESGVKPVRPVGVELVTAILALSGLYFVANIQNVIWLLNFPMGVLLLLSSYGAWNGRRFAYRLTEASLVLVLIGNTLFLVIVYHLAGFLPVEDVAIPVWSAIMTAVVFVYFRKPLVLEWFGRTVQPARESTGPG